MANEARIPEEHHISVFENKWSAMRAVVCSCGFATTYTTLTNGPDAAGMEFFERRHKEHIERIADLEADWKRLNRVFKSTSDKTIDQDMKIERLQAALKAKGDERDTHIRVLCGQITDLQGENARLKQPVTDEEWFELWNTGFLCGMMGDEAATKEGVNRLLASRSKEQAQVTPKLDGG